MVKEKSRGSSLTCSELEKKGREKKEEEESRKAVEWEGRERAG